MPYVIGWPRISRSLGRARSWVRPAVLAVAHWLAVHFAPELLEGYKRRLADSNARVQIALEELQTEEMRVRRLVSDRLHGNLQNRMVSISAGIDGVARALRANGDLARAAELTSLADQLDVLREREVRDLSHTLFPAGIELGAVRAIEAMFSRLPPQIETSVTIGPFLAARIAEGIPLMPLAERLIIVTAVEEAITNALKHGGATKIELVLELIPQVGEKTNDFDATGPVAIKATVIDNGTGLDPAFYLGAARHATAHTGMSRHLERLEMRGGHLYMWSPPTGEGTRVELTLPLNPVG